MSLRTLFSFGRLGRLVYRRRKLVLAAWALAFVVLGGILSANFSSNTVAEDHTIVGSDSARADGILRDRFDRPVDEHVIVTFDSDEFTVDAPAFRATVESTLHAAERADSGNLVVGVADPYGPDGSTLISEDGRAAIAVLGVRGSEDDRRDLLPRLTTAVDGTDGPVRVHVTGDTAIALAVDEQSDADLARAETIGLPVALAVLLIGFGALLAAALPIALALVGIAVTFGVLGIAAYATDFVSLTESATTLIGLGIGIDFAMFLVARYREALQAGATTEHAVVTAVATSGRSVFFSAGTVVIAVTGLFLVDNGIFHDFAIGIIAAAAVMAAAALTLLPALLALFGRRVVRRRDRSAVRTAAARSVWDRWADAVMRRPAVAGLGAVAILVTLALPVTGIRLGLNAGADTIADRDAGEGLAVLEEHFASGALSPITVVLATDQPYDDSDLGTIGRLADRLRGDPQVAAVTTVLDALRAHGLPQNPDALAELTAEDPAAAELISRDRDATTFTVVPRGAVDGTAAQDLVRRIRDDYRPEVAGAGLELAVTGQTAGIVDLGQEVGTELPWVLAYVLGVSLLLLLVVFRSPVLALKAIVMNLLSVGAAYGLLVWVFQQGHGAGLLDASTDGTIQAWLPIVAFAILFGISMDYEVFLLGRMREEWDRTGDNRAAVRAGLRHTARPITSAAAIQVAVFGAFVFTRVPEVQQLGFALATAIAIDATLVRIVLVPAAMRLMGRANWWSPSWLPAPRPHADPTADIARPARHGTPPDAMSRGSDIDERALMRSTGH